MSPQHIAPYLTHLVSHHGQLTLVPPDSSGRRRKAREERPTDTASSRVSRRSSRPIQADDYDIPDYPPPSFQEAILTPPVSVCPSTTTLGQFTTPAPSRHASNSDSDSESDDTSLDIVDPGHSPPRASPVPRGRGILDSDSDNQPRTPSRRPSRRHLSLSPLRTLFPSRNTGQNAPSPQSLAFSRTSPFFRSSTSLRNLTADSPPSPSVQSENSLGSRRFFAHKGKERGPAESLTSWEIVESMLPEDLSQREESVAQEPAVNASPVSSTPHPLSERDRRTKIKNWRPPVRERRRPVPPPPPPPVTFPSAPGEAPPIVTVRTRKPPPPPPPKKKPAPVASPLRATAGPSALQDLDLDRALQTPLPSTPVAGSPTSFFAFSEENAPHLNATSLNSPQSSLENSEHTGRLPPPPPPPPPPPNHHYPGRPLPRRPRLVVDSTYAPHPAQLLSPVPSVPEGLLIDLNEVPMDASSQSMPSASISADLNQLQPPLPAEMQRSSSASSVDLAPPSSSEFMEVTDLDVLIARLENDQHDGANYDALLLVSEFIGPASPVRAIGPRPASPSRVSRPAGPKPSALLSGQIEVLRRRTTKDGRVKLKLALLGVAVDRCGICMTQFKNADHARMIDVCKHAFHERCLARWVMRSRTCPLCRIGLSC